MRFMTLMLNLASGTDLRPPPWVNLDVVPRWPGTDRGCDVLWDARTDRIPFPDNSAEEIYAGYLLLHLGPRHHEPVLAEIRRVLRPGASCVFGEVDMAVVMRRWLARPDDIAVSELIWGEQGSAHGDDLSTFDKHCWGFSESKLRGALERAGFVGIHRIQIHVDAVYYELTLRCTKP
jgi:SAM-dependent methyltransferase